MDSDKNLDPKPNSSNGHSERERSFLTTQQLIHEVTALKELIFASLEGANKEVTLLHERLSQFPHEIDKAVLHLKEVNDGKFDGIQVQFKERDLRIEQAFKDTKSAVNDALLSAKEAVAEQNRTNLLSSQKTEASTTKLIDQLQINMTVGNKAIDDKITDVKDRLVLIEGKTSGMEKADKAGIDRTGIYIGVAALIFTALLAIATIIPTFRPSSTTAPPPSMVYINPVPITPVTPVTPEKK